MQMPVFAQLGLDLSQYYPGTVNVAIAPYRYTVCHPRHTFRQVKWAADRPAEDFSFFDCTVSSNGRAVDALVYYPHPETKPEHFQDPQTLEILAPYLDELRYGQRLDLQLDPQQIAVKK